MCARVCAVLHHAVLRAPTSVCTTESDRSLGSGALRLPHSGSTHSRSQNRRDRSSRLPAQRRRFSAGIGRTSRLQPISWYAKGPLGTFSSQRTTRAVTAASTTSRICVEASLSEPASRSLRCG
jgi:hypothetical protein